VYFGEKPTRDAEGCLLAHSITAGNARIRKGQRLTQTLIRQLLDHGTHTITVAELGPDDIHEDEAARQLATALAGHGVYLGEARTGRVNLHASDAGLLEIDRDAVFACNAVSDSITFATLGQNLWVPEGKLVATAKIIPFAVPGDTLEAAIAATVGAAVCLHTPTPHRAHLIQTTVEGTSQRMLEKTTQVTAARLLARNAKLASSTQCKHELNALVDEITSITHSPDTGPSDWILIVGASAICDPEDVIPAAIKHHRGTVKRLGIPVDPGNLLMWAELGEHTVIGLPGCARSPKHNGFDQFLDRLACDLDIAPEWITSLSVGGLLNEIPERPEQRSRQLPSGPDSSRGDVSAIILAAGRSQRFGEENKLLAKWDKHTLLFKTMENVLASDVADIVLVTGHEQEKVLASIEPLLSASSSTKPIRVVHNPNFADGMASSLQAALSHLATRSTSNDNQLATPTAVLVCLGDMPNVAPATMNQLLQAHASDAEASAIVPSYQKQRGNPVILTSGLFDTLLSQTGDSGARDVLKKSPGIVRELPVNDPGVLFDIDSKANLDEGNGP